MSTGEQESIIPQSEEQTPISEEQTPISEEWGEDISPDQDKGIFKKILTPGSGSETPPQGCEVIVHYTGRLLNGDVFDSSVERDEKFKFKLGEGQVIKGWDVGVATMIRGEKCLLTCAPGYAYGENGSQPKIGPNETLQFEVELFDWQGEDITSDGGVVKTLITKGENYSTPEDGTVVEAHIRGTYDGRTFQEADVTFEFGEGSEKDVVDGVEKAIGTMKHKESARIIVQPQYAYGDKGYAELGIPGGAELVYDVRLNNFTKAKEPWDYETLEERLAAASHLKDRGGKYFKEGKYELACKLYQRGADLITDTSLRKEDIKEAAKPMRVALHLNMAACHLKMKDPESALKECTEVLTDDAENVKAYFRQGQAHQILQNFEEAMESFRKVLELEPTNKAAQTQLSQTRLKVKELRNREKQRYANMFDKLAAMSKDEGPKDATKAEESTQEPVHDMTPETESPGSESMES